MRRFEKESKDFDATGGQLMVLKFLYDHENEDVYQKDIEKFIDVRGSTATVILQTLTKKGYIKRVACSSDGRLKKIVLCEKAKKVIVEFDLTHIDDIVHPADQKVYLGSLGIPIPF